MLIGCLVIFIGAFAVFGKGASIGSLLWIVSPLLCVVMHFFMMRHGKDKGNHH